MELRLLRRSWAVVLGVIASTPAAAEVCDKVRPAWNPADGPIRQFEDLALFFTEPLGLIVFVLTIAAVLFRKIWLTVIVVALMVAIIALNISTWLEADDITNFAIKDGLHHNTCNDDHCVNRHKHHHLDSYLAQNKTFEVSGVTQRSLLM